MSHCSALRRLIAADADVDQCLCPTARRERVALPLREQVARVDDQPAGRDRRIPADLRRLEAVAWPVVRDVHAVVIAAVRHVRPAIVAAGQDEVDLVAAARAHLSLPQPPVRREREAKGVAMAGAPGFRGRQVRPGPGDVVRQSLRDFGVLGRIGDGDASPRRFVRPADCPAPACRRASGEGSCRAAGWGPAPA